MKIAYIAAGAAGMYCGSCIRDNTLVRAMQDLGHEAILIPTYTPLRTDEPGVAIDRLFYNGLNVYLEEKYAFFRPNRPWLDKLLDRPWIVQRLAKANARTSARDLGALTVSMLKAESGHQQKELQKLVAWLRDEFRPELVQITNSMLVGMARELRQQLNVPVLCAFQGEDIFLDDLIEPYKSEALALLRERCKDADGFISTSAYYSDYMSQYVGILRESIHTVPLGITLQGHTPAEPRAAVSDFNVGYLARICPEKGLHLLVDAFKLLTDAVGKEQVRLRIAGYLGKRDEAYWQKVLRQIAGHGLADRVDIVGEVDRQQKIEFLRSVQVVSVPTVYHEPKGLFLLEALANGVPVVQPAHGAFPELLRATGGGLLVEPNSASALANGLMTLRKDEALRRDYGEAGHAAVHAKFSAGDMARETLKIYQHYLSEQEEATVSSNGFGDSKQAERLTMSSNGRHDIYLKVRNLGKQFQGPANTVEVLNGISFELYGGEALAITGPSGSGKSTLLHLLGTLDSPTSGSIEINGTIPLDFSEPQLAQFRNKSIGFVFQGHHLLPQYTVIENVLIPTLATRSKDSNKIERAQALLERVGLSHRLDHLPAALSGGERQRVAIARALINKPAVVLCDEPTGNLDAVTAESVADLLFELHQQEQNILIVVTHSQTLAARFDRRFELLSGKLSTV